MPDELEHLDKIIQRLGIERREVLPEVVPALACPQCHGAGYLRYDVPVDDSRFGELIECECTRAELAARRHQILLERSRLGHLRHYTFDNWVAKTTDANTDRRTLPDDAYIIGKAYSQELHFEGRPWLFLYGTVGTGKTRIAAAIGNCRIDRGESAIFMVVPELLDYLRAAYSPSSDIGYDELFESLKNTPLLILDELGVDTATPWAREKLFQLINHRYNSRIPTVLTMNMEADPIDPRLWSRINDRELTTVCEPRWSDHRTSAEQRRKPKQGWVPGGHSTRP